MTFIFPTGELLVRAYLLSDVPGVRLRRSATTNAAAAAANFWPLSGICIDVQAFSRMFFQPRSEALRSRTVTPDSTRDLAPPSCSWCNCSSTSLSSSLTLPSSCFLLLFFCFHSPQKSPPSPSESSNTIPSHSDEAPRSRSCTRRAPLAPAMISANKPDEQDERSSSDCSEGLRTHALADSRRAAMADRHLASKAGGRWSRKTVRCGSRQALAQHGRETPRESPSAPPSKKHRNRAERALQPQAGIPG